MRLAIVLATVAACAAAADYRPPAGTRTAARRPGAESVLPGGRMIAPLGRQFTTGPGAFGLAVSPDAKLAVTANAGGGRYSLSILDMTAEPWHVKNLAALKRDEKAASEEEDWRSVFMGLAFSEDRRLFVSEGNSGRVRDITVPSGKVHSLYHLNQGQWRDSYSGDLAYDAAKQVLYVVDQTNFRVAVFDAKSRKLLIPLLHPASPKNTRVLLAALINNEPVMPRS